MIVAFIIGDKNEIMVEGDWLNHGCKSNAFIHVQVYLTNYVTLLHYEHYLISRGYM